MKKLLHELFVYAFVTLAIAVCDLWLWTASSMPKTQPDAQKYAAWRPGYGFQVWLKYGLKEDR